MVLFAQEPVQRHNVFNFRPTHRCDYNTTHPKKPERFFYGVSKDISVFILSKGTEIRLSELSTISPALINKVTSFWTYL